MTGVKNIGASFDGSGEMPEDRGTAIGDRIRDCVSLDGRIAFVKKYAQDEKVMRVVLEHFPTLFPYADPSLRKKKIICCIRASSPFECLFKKCLFKR